MTSLVQLVADRLQTAAGVDVELRPATNRDFGHFQSSVALRLAKQRGAKPRDVAAEIVAAADVEDLCEPLEIAGPGFINVRLKPATLGRAVTELLADPDLGVARAAEPKRVVVDYSSPNVAKQMHVGHLRSTIIGDAFARVLGALGHDVIRRNHIGDWGRQFGMLVEQILDEGADAAAMTLTEAEDLYRRAKQHFDADADFAERARRRVVALQSGDPETRAIWQALIDISMAGFRQDYARLNVLLTDDDVAGESSYNDELDEVVADLEARGIAVEDDGALCAFVEGFEAPMILRKRDGGYGYDATDMTAIRQRVRDLGAQRIIYVTDVRQGPHFHQVFATARKAGYVPDDVATEFVGFGMVLGQDGKPFKTREGTAVSLASLLDEAERLAAPEIALAAVKYADLSNSLQKDYVFDADRMVQTTGDTGPYIQYAHARTCTLFRRDEAQGLDDTTVSVVAEPDEVDLALLLTQFGEVVADVAESLQPHKLCTYLYQLATAYSRFYEHCPILSAEGETRTSRLALARATQRVLARGLDLLGIVAPERM